MGMEKPYLVVADMDKIHGYIFASQRMREVRGASYLVSVVSRNKTIELLGRFGKGNYNLETKRFDPTLPLASLDWKVIYCAGGALKVKFNSKKEAQAFQCALEAMFRAETISGSITTAAVEIDDSKYAELIQKAEAKLRYAKDGKKELIQRNNSPFHRRCDSCGDFTAENRHIFDDEELFLCRACEKKREFQKDDDENGEPSKRLPIYDRIEEAIAEQFDHQVALDPNYPKDFGDIGKRSKPENYMGFISADGNRMGEKMRDIFSEELKKADEADEIYSKFSNAVLWITQEALVEAVMEAFTPDIERRLGKKRHITYQLPLEVIILGGDDLVFVTTADKALPIAQRFCHNFHQATTDSEDIRLKNGISISAGVVLAKQKFPFLTYQRIADELLKSAKKLSLKINRENQGTEVGTLDFMVVTGSAVGSLEDVRSDLKYQERFRDVTIADKLEMTARPYTIADFNKLLTGIKALRHFPNNKLKAFRDLLRRGRYQSVIEYALLREKHGRNRRDSARDSGIIQALRQIETDFMTEGMAPWKRLKKQNTYMSSLLDIVEIYEFVR